MSTNEIDPVRRDLLALGAGAPALAALASIAPSAAAAADASTPGAAWRPLRRVVVSDAPDGHARVLADGAPQNAFVLNGTRITRLWEQPGLPATVPLAVDAGATAGNAYRAGFAGTSFYLAELPPGTDTAAIPLHRNDTLDYMAILAGEVDLVLEDRSIPLRTGDTLVLGGSKHSWANRGAASCLLLFVVVTAARSAAGG